MALAAVGAGAVPQPRCTRSYLSDLLPTMVLLGVGGGLAFPSLMTIAMSSATPEDAGIASGLVNTTQQVGGALGLAVLATLSSTHRAARCWPTATRSASSLTNGYHLAFTIGAVLIVVATALAVFVLPSASAAGAQEVPEADVEEQPPALGEADFARGSRVSRPAQTTAATSASAACDRLDQLVDLAVADDQRRREGDRVRVGQAAADDPPRQQRRHHRAAVSGG